MYIRHVFMCNTLPPLNIPSVTNTVITIANKSQLRSVRETMKVCCCWVGQTQAKSDQSKTIIWFAECGQILVR